MSEAYIEYLVKRKPNPIMMVVKYVFYILTAICLFLGISGYLMLMIVGAIFGVIAYFMNLNSMVEFEYLFLNKEFSVDRILGQTKRKKVKEFQLSGFEILAPAGSPRLNSYMQNKKCVAYDYSSKTVEGKPYIFVCNGDSEIARVTIDMTDEILKCFKSVSPRKVFED